jgi:AcrR family transcriptional regulator
MESQAVHNRRGTSRPGGRGVTAAKTGKAGAGGTAGADSTTGAGRTGGRTGAGRTTGDSQHRRPGRPRSEQADQAIMAAALDLFADSGPAGLCIEQVAARAGVGKASIYRRWPGKEDMLLDGLAVLAAALPVPQGRSVRADLIALLDAICKEAADPRRVRLAALLLGEGRQYPRLRARYLETVEHPRREAIRAVLRRGVATGELRENTDIEAAVYLLNGAVLASMHSERVDGRYARRVVEELLRGLTAR